MHIKPIINITLIIRLIVNLINIEIYNEQHAKINIKPLYLILTSC